MKLARSSRLLSAGSLFDVTEEVRRQIRMADEWSVSDYVADLEKFDRKLQERTLVTCRTTNGDCRTPSTESAIGVDTQVRQENQAIMNPVDALYSDRRRKGMRRQHMETLSSCRSSQISVAWRAHVLTRLRPCEILPN